MMERHEIIEALKPIEKTNAFAMSLLDQYRRKGTLSERQWDTAEVVIHRFVETQKPKAKVDVSRIEGLLHTAKGNGLKRPVFRADGLTLSLAGEKSRNPGAVYVKVGGEYAGKVQDGQWHPVRTAMPETLATLTAIAINPREAAINYGRLTGSCACCGRTLTDPQSVELGIGPICAERWGI